ncbi:hypothetical protein LRC39_15150 [Rhodopseudomonas sp. P1]|uniref:hypothetical protein n=1 Tax=Rhodopseudomonas sp. P1 TaxID=3434357 RepID=UPI0031FBCEED
MAAMDESPKDPDTENRTVYLVLDDFGREGRAFREADYDRCDLESVTADPMAGEFENPTFVVAFNLRQGWARDATTEVIHEVQRRVRSLGCEVPIWLSEFVDCRNYSAIENDAAAGREASENVSHFEG